MATAAQIEANRRNARKSTVPRSEEGKNRSRMNALDHGCRANVLVLPVEEFGRFETEVYNWKLSLRPRNPAEELLVERLVTFNCLKDRIWRAHTARLRKRILDRPPGARPRAGGSRIDTVKPIGHLRQPLMRRPGGDVRDGCREK